MKHLLKEGQLKREVPFMGGVIDVRKTTVRDLRDVQELAKTIDFTKDTEETMQFVYNTLRRFVDGASDMTDEEFEEFPVEDLSGLIQTILGSGSGNE